MHKDITEIFCFIDDFAKLYEQKEKSTYYLQIGNDIVNVV